MPLPPKPWPETEPSGLPFPYSHFGDPDVRVALLRNIAQAVKIEPELVVNLGSGFDVTPSIAFPEAETIHIDYQTDIVGFLGGIGFKACTPDDLPRDLQPDMAINVLGGSLAGFAHRGMRLSEGGVYITTEGYSRYVPDGMAALALVNDDLEVITDPDAMDELWEGDQSIHLGVYTPYE